MITVIVILVFVCLYLHPFHINSHIYIHVPMHTQATGGQKTNEWLTMCIKLYSKQSHKAFLKINMKKEPQEPGKSSFLCIVVRVLIIIIGFIITDSCVSERCDVVYLTAKFSCK